MTRLILTCSNVSGGKPSGKEVKQRSSKLECNLTTGFVEEQGCEVSREIVLAYVALDEASAPLVTRTLKRVFPTVSTRRRREDGTYPCHLHNYSQKSQVPIGQKAFPLGLLCKAG